MIFDGAMPDSVADILTRPDGTSEAAHKWRQDSPVRKQSAVRKRHIADNEVERGCETLTYRHSVRAYATRQEAVLKSQDLAFNWILWWA